MTNPRCPEHDELYEVTPGTWLCLHPGCTHRVNAPKDVDGFASAEWTWA